MRSSTLPATLEGVTLLVAPHLVRICCLRGLLAVPGLSALPPPQHCLVDRPAKRCRLTWPGPMIHGRSAADLGQIRAQDPDHVEGIVQSVLAAQPADDVSKALVILKRIGRPVRHLADSAPRYIMHLALMNA